jgi:hypothetical protein
VKPEDKDRLLNDSGVVDVVLLVREAPEVWTRVVDDG